MAMELRFIKILIFCKMNSGFYEPHNNNEKENCFFMSPKNFGIMSLVDNISIFILVVHHTTI